ncbi:MAG: carbohydrate ABC transporter substrate-binding protein, partial [Oscillospiraceae bacterium]|nr:carbohydrate ABC transporter substrate-binding protein [Oscillospiraceae bacterium]
GNGVVKGVSFQCCPSALIYRRSIAKDVLGTDDPAEVQSKLDSWEKFEAVAADAKAKGYYMTASFAETYRPFSNNCTSPWVNENNELQFDPQILAWIAQTEKFVENGYTLADSGIWDQPKNDQMFATGKTMCFFGPAWYFNFCMGNAQDPEKGCVGDWAICEGPAAHFWGGTWLMAPAGTDNPTLLADIMNTFINDADVCEKLVVNEAQFSNNQAVNAKFANDPAFGSEFLGGQNPVAVFSAMTDNIKWENHTIYDQACNEGLQNKLQEYFQGLVEKDTALNNFYLDINEKYPDIVTP